MTGAGTSAAHGYPDFGLITMSEMVANARRLCDALSIPLVSDIDTGYGNELNVYRTVQEFERAGVAAMHLEDQVFPKKCGHLDDKEVISLDDYVAKIRAAADARQSKDFTIIARTDSRAVLGFDEAIRRGNAALAAGADMVFVEAPQTLEEVTAVPKRIQGPCMLNIVLGGKTPIVDMADRRKAGLRAHHRSGPADALRRRSLRRGSEGIARHRPAACQHHEARAPVLQSLRRRRMGQAPHRLSRDKKQAAE